MERPPHINGIDWQRMSWHARQRAVRRAGLHLVSMPQEPSMPAGQPPRRVRVYRVEPGCWEISNGVSAARVMTAEAAWRLLDHLARTA